jgi:DNA-binding transcriptional LysR family regulator
MVNIRKLDLNLFIALEALVRERSVTRAADRLGLSQPAVSAALKRLRQQLGDPLLVRTRNGMSPTPRAQEIYASLGHSLDSLQNVVQDGPAFAPERTQRSFNLMLSDIGEIVYLPRLIERLQYAAPGMRLTIRRLVRPRVSEELGTGRVDLAIGWVDRPNDVYRDQLFMEDFVCIVRPGHPRVGKKRLTFSQIATEWHLVVGRPDAGPDMFLRAANANMERVFSKAVRERKIALLVPHFLAVPNIIANTDLLCMVPRQLGQVYEALGQVRLVPLPVKCESFAVSQFWHKRYDTDQGNVWLRAQVRELFSKKAGP